VLLATCGALLLLVGCTGAFSVGLGSLFGSAMLGLALLLHGCRDENCREYTECIDGEVVTHELCCPEGTECNYGLPFETCADGTCLERGSGDSCPQSDAGIDAGSDGGSDGGCVPQSVTTCVDREVRASQICCPAGVACDPLPIERCDDGSCASAGQMCAEACDGYVAQTCEQGDLVDVCCPIGVACNYGLGLEICPDGSCSYQGCPPSCEDDAGDCADAG
jgi:hypothetical protein